MAYREAAPPPEEKIAREYGPFPLRWHELFVVGVCLVVAVFPVVALFQESNKLGDYIFLPIMAGLILAAAFALLRRFLSSTRSLKLRIAGTELEVLEQRPLGERCQKVSLRGLRAVEAISGKKGHRIVLRFDDDREVVLRGGEDIHQRIADDLRRALLPDDTEE